MDVQASSFKFDSGLFNSFRNDRDKLQFICAGTAAGTTPAPRRLVVVG